MKKRVNLMVEDYDNEYLDATAETMHISKSDLVKLAINLLTSVNENDEDIFTQLVRIYDQRHPHRADLPMNEKIIRASTYINVTIS